MSSARWISLFVLCLSTIVAVGQDDVFITGEFDKSDVNTIFRRLTKDYGVKLAYDSRHFKRSQSGPFSFLQTPLNEVFIEVLSPHGFEVERVADVWVVVPSDTSAESGSTDEVRFNLDIRGRVVDAYSGEGLPGASIGIRGTDRLIGSGSEGFFVLKSVPSDTSELIVSFIGYTSRVIRLTPSRARHEVVVKLTRSMAALPPVVVESGPFSVISREPNLSRLHIDPRLSRQMAHTGEPDVFAAAQMAAGVSASTESGSGVEIRGTSESLSMTELDGFNLYHTDHLLGSISAVSPEFVRDIRVHRGVLPAAKGGSAGGLIEINGRDGNRLREEVTVGINALTSSLTLSLPMQEGGGALLVSGRTSHVQWVQTPAYRSMFGAVYNPGIPQTGPDPVDVFASGTGPEVGFWDVVARANIDPSARKKMAVSILSSRDRMRFGYDQPIEFPGSRWTYSDEANWGNTGASLRMTDSWSNGWISQTTVSASRFKSESKATDIREDLWFGETDTLFSHLTNQISDVGLRYDLRFSRDKSDWLVGADVRQYWVEYRSFRPDNLTDEAINQSALIGGLYAETTIRSQSGYQWGVGVRLETMEGRHFYPAPKLAMTKTINEHWAWSAEAGRQWMQVQRLTRQDISFNDPVLWRVADHDRMNPTRLDHFGVGLQRTAKNFSISAEGYYRWLKNANLHRSAFPVAAIPDDLPVILSGDGTVVGVDLMFVYAKASHRLLLAGSGGLSVIRLPLPDPRTVYSPPHRLAEIKAMYQLNHKGWMASITTVYAHGRPFTPLIGSYFLPLPNETQREIPVFGQINSGRLPDYYRLDIMLGREFEWRKMNASLGLNVYNLLDRRNIRDVRYFALATSADPGSFTTAVSEPGMLGRMPGLFLRVSF